MDPTPKVSILLPAYNRHQYLSAAIESVLAQTYQNWELLISDNCSSDNTPAIANQYAKQDKRINYWRNDCNIGSALNYNKCIEKASGDYIELFGADDIFEPTCLETFVQVLNENPGVVLTTSAKRHIDENGRLIREDRPYIGSRRMASAEAIRSNISTLTNWIISPVMYRSKYKDNGLDLALGIYSDLDYWAQILKHGDLYYIDKVLFNYRVHPGSETTRRLTDLEFIPTLLRTAERHAAYLTGPENPDAQPYKIVIEKLMDLVDYSTNFLKLNFDSMFGLLALRQPERGTLKMVNSQFSENSDSSNDLRDFKRISYLALLHASALRKELNWLYEEYNDLKRQPSGSNVNSNGRTGETDSSCLNKASWPRHMKILNEVRQENESLHHRIDELSKQLNTLLNSQSWRITAPLRMVRKNISAPEP